MNITLPDLYKKTVFLPQLVRVIGYVSLAAMLWLAPMAYAKKQPMPAQRWFVEAQQAYKTGNKQRYQQLLAKLLNYPLYPYLQYADLNARLSELPAADVALFLTQYPDTVLANQLHQRWLSELARQQQWSLLLSFYQPTLIPTNKIDRIKLKCHILHAKLQVLPSTVTQSEHQKLIKELWLTGYPRPNVCDPIFAYWIKHDLITTQNYWQRVKLAFFADQLRLVNHLQKQAPQVLQSDIALWKKVYKNPSQVINILQKKQVSKKNKRELFTLALKRLASTKPKKSMALAKEIDKSGIKLTAAQQQLWYRVLGVTLARQGNWQQAAIFLGEINQKHTDKKVYYWQLRTGIALQDWSKLSAWLGDVPEEIRQQNPMWDYWYARALAQQGKKRQANAIWYKLINQPNYYGILARQQLKITQLPMQLTLDKPNIPKHVVENPSLNRAHELWQLKQEKSAKKEWQHGLVQLSKADQAAAAMLAQQWGWYNMSILTAIRTDNKRHITLYAPLAYRDIVNQYANQHQLALAWIFAIIRQESAYISHARSHAGALGLMQLLPSTARMVSKHHRIPVISKQHLLHPKTNIALGSAYLKKLWDRFNHWILATIAYNAGPTRVAAWLEKHNIAAMPLDLFIEQLPWFETRNYIKNVIYYVSIYQHQLGEKAISLTLPFSLFKAGKHDKKSHTP